MCVGVTVWFGWGGVVWYPYAGFSLHKDYGITRHIGHTTSIGRKLTYLTLQLMVSAC